MTRETPDLERTKEAEDLRVRLAEAEGTLRAIREGEADALVIDGDQGDEVHVLDRSDRIYRQFVEVLTEGTATLSMAGEVLSCDESLAKTLRRPLIQIVGTPMTDHVSDDDREKFSAALARPAGRSSRELVRLTSGDGRSIPMHLSVSVLRSPAALDVLCVVFTDWAEVVSAEDLLRRSAERYRQLVMLAPVAIAVFSEGRVAFLNPAGMRLLGASADGEILGKPLEEFIHPDSLDGARARIRRMTAGEQGIYPAESVVVKLDGTPIDVEITATPVSFEDSAAIQAVLVDITARKTATKMAGHLLQQKEQHLQQLTRAFASTVEIVSQIAETRDPYTAGHQRRVSELSVRISESMGMSPEQTDEIRIASLLHDIGKMSVPAEILSKPGKLSDIEFELTKGHAEAGYRIIAAAHLEGSTAEIVYQHHERCDGTGYPRGLGAADLLTAAKVISVADVVEAMVSHRPYRPGLGVDVALAEIARGAGLQYDVDVSEACIRLFREDGFVFLEV